MDSRTAETTNARTAYGSHPLPERSTKGKREQARVLRSDAQLVVRWLNAALDSGATASHDRVAGLHRSLTQFAECRVNLQKPGSTKWSAALVQLEEQRRLVAAGGKCKGIRFPARRYNPKLLRQAEALHESVNQALYQYVFRPRVTYFLHSELWLGGMAPDARPEWFETSLNGLHVSEADAVLALIRLDLVGELGKVRLCEMCHRRWCVAARRHYRFCSKGCRESWHETQPGYHERKAKNARRYRQLEKRRAMVAFAMPRQRRK
jgi:hypothetical protein